MEMRPRTKSSEWPSRRTLLLSLATICVAGAAFCLWPRKAFPYEVIIIDPSVTNVKITTTKGSEHNFYFPSRFRYAVEKARESLGRTPEQQTTHIKVTAPEEIVWVMCYLKEPLPQFSKLETELIDAEGRFVVRFGPSANSTKTEHLALLMVPGSTEKYKGGTIRIWDKKTKREFVKVRIR